jgi:meso-butanediol dehydrogenase / (S,S)-butanediol dehydrogenase / diacetyl reductase
MTEKAVLSGKVALITGGGTGIGEGIARRFTEEGAKVCITGRRREPLESAVSRMPAGSAFACVGDVSNEEDVLRMVQAALDIEGKIDVLVNNAGIGMQGAVHELDPAAWRQVLAINLTGPFLMMRAVIPHLLSNGGGSIINISSVGGVRAIPGAASYCASKAGLIHLSKQVAIDYAAGGIRCNAVCPGYVGTEMVDVMADALAEMKGIDRDSAYRMLSKQPPVGRISTPADVAGLCLYLASDDSAYMTGAELVIDGGGAPMDILTSVFRA